MTITAQKNKNELRVEFAVFLMKNKLNLMSFLSIYNDEVNKLFKRERSIMKNYALIWNRLHSCVKIDLNFVQSLIDLVDKTHKVQVIRDRVVIGKPFLIWEN